MADLLANIGRFRPDSDPLKPLYEARQRGRLGDLRNVVSQQMGMEDPDKQVMLGSLAQVDPVRAMQMGGFDATKQKGGRPISGNFARAEQLRLQAEPLELELNSIAQQAISKITQDVNADTTQEQAQINDLTTRISTLTGKPPRSPLKTKLDELLKLKGAVRADTAEARAGEQFAYKKAEEAQDEKAQVMNQASTEYYKPEMVQFRSAKKANDRVNALMSEAKRGNPTAQVEMIVALKKMSDASQVLLSEIGSVTDPSLENKMQGFYQKVFNGQVLTDKEISDASKTAKAIVSTADTGYSKLIDDIEYRADEMGKNFGIKKWDVRKWLGESPNKTKSTRKKGFKKVH